MRDNRIAFYVVPDDDMSVAINLAYFSGFVGATQRQSRYGPNIARPTPLLKPSRDRLLSGAFLGDAVEAI